MDQRPHNQQPLADRQSDTDEALATDASAVPAVHGTSLTTHARNGSADVESTWSPIQLVPYGAVASAQDSSEEVLIPRSPDPSHLSGEPIGPGDVVARQPPSGDDVYPIDLATALRLAGAGNLQIALAVERVQEALARQDAARVLWIPSFNAGVVYNKHDGRIQETQGEILEASRNSLFVGGGPVLLNSALAAGAGPSRLFVDLPLVDVLFEPLAARRLVRWSNADRAATFNDTLLEVTSAYLNLLRAQGQVAIAGEAVDNAQELARLTAEFARTGAGLEADAQRAQAELAGRRRRLLQAEEQVAVTSAELARLLRLDPAVLLIPAESQPVPIELVDENIPLQSLIDQAVASRPELARSGAAIEETYARLPSRAATLPGGRTFISDSAQAGLGGGEGSFMGNFSDRSDFDAAAVWELENFGLGNRARQRERESIHLQAHLVAAQIRDLVATEVTQAVARTRLRRNQIEAAQSQVLSAQDGLQLNLEGIRGFVLRPIEAQQALEALANARQQYLDAVIDYNQAQAELLRAIGQPLTDRQLSPEE